jgi:hypothetical protein
MPSVPDDNLCAQNDTTVCNGTAVCNLGAGNANPVTGCAEPFPNGIVCPDDGIACTVEACVEPFGCKRAVDNLLCPCGQFCDPAKGGCGLFCQPATCQGKTYACGDCVDNDLDCVNDASDPNSGVDSTDLSCLGPCQDNETGLSGQISGQNNAPCKMDCYWDADTGDGNDHCKWDHRCDPLLPSAQIPKCDTYKSDTQLAGGNPPVLCADAMASQELGCWDSTVPTPSGNNYCGSLTPNGCDCFGCCLIPGKAQAVFVGSQTSGGVDTCTLDTLNDPTKCKPCTQVPSCTNTCETCEICVGKPTLPPACTCQTCPLGAQLCGGPCGTACAAGEYCKTGCCTPVPE